MPLDTLEKKQIMDLLVLSLEGAANARDLEKLRNILHDSDEARDYYIQAVTIVENARKMEWETERPQIQSGLGNDFNHEFWTAFAEQEKMAPTIDIPKASPDPKLIQKVVYPPREKRRFSKLSIATFVLTAAAMVFLLIFIKFVPVNQRVEVATLQDNINVRWGEASMLLNKGDRLLSGSSHSLLGNGFVTLLFDNNANVTIEGPAEFKILSEDCIELQYGRLYSIVPNEAIGFSITTPNSIIIDLGTQFGVEVDFRGNTELHMSQGRTMLIGGNKKKKIAQEVHEGTAYRVSYATMQVSEIPYNDTAFVRQINSKTDLIWRGQLSFNLCDIFCGGNGLGTAHSEEGINPVTGEIAPWKANDREGSEKYVAVPKRRFIDGVFVPNGNHKPVVVSSQNHVFSECPPTNNIFYSDPHMGSNENRLNFEGEMAKDIQLPDTDVPPSLMLHANLGITFDLDKIRASYPLVNLEQFKSWVGVAGNANREPNTDVWVLVDGNVKYSQKQIREKGRPYPIQVDLKQSDHFLTLIATDGEDEDVLVNGGRATDSDWCLFVRPELVLSDVAIE